MTAAISVTGLTRRYHSHLALDQVSFEVEAGSITGLLGRNGAGKTTLLRILAGQEFPSAGRVLIHGAPPTENEAVLRRLVFVREDQVYPDFKVCHALRIASWFYPNWSAELAETLLADDGLLEKRRGIGMFVASGARKQLLAQRRDEFPSRYVEPLLTEAARLGIGADELVALVSKSAHSLPLNKQGGITA